MRQMKKILALGITGAMLLAPSNAFASPANGRTLLETMVNPRFAYDYEETITRTYLLKSDVPDTYYYEYYNNDWGCWFRGMLDLQKIESSGKKFKATFTGTMYGSPT